MSENLGAVTSFFQNVSASSDVSQAIYATAWIYKLVTVLIGIIGMGAAGIYLSRLAIDIICLAGRGTGIEEKLGKYGTAEAGTYNNAGEYLKNNIPEILMMVTLIIFLITGWLFTLLAFVINGLGTLFNKFAGIDVIGSVSSLNAKAFEENLSYQKSSQLSQRYTEETEKARKYYDNVMELGSQSVDSPKLKQFKQLYTDSMAKATIMGQLLKDRGADTELKSAGWFQQHLKQSDTDPNSYCNSEFIVADVTAKYTSANVTCQR